MVWRRRLIFSANDIGPGPRLLAPLVSGIDHRGHAVPVRLFHGPQLSVHEFLERRRPVDPPRDREHEPEVRVLPIGLDDMPENPLRDTIVLAPHITKLPCAQDRVGRPRSRVPGRFLHPYPLALFDPIPDALIRSGGSLWDCLGFHLKS